MDERVIREVERAADALVRDLQEVTFLAQVPPDRLRPLCLWASNLGLDSQALLRLVFTAGTQRLASLGDEQEDLLAAIMGGVSIRVGGDDDYPF